jgi:hypothetical protein
LTAFRHHESFAVPLFLIDLVFRTSVHAASPQWKKSFK